MMATRAPKYWTDAFIGSDAIDEISDLLKAAGFEYVEDDNAWRGPLCHPVKCTTSVALLLVKQVLRGDIPSWGTAR